MVQQSKKGSGMKRIIIYFSLEGNTEYIADELAKVLPADKLKLVPKKAYSTSGFSKFFWGGKSAVMAEKPELEPYDVDLSVYDEIIFGFPVWAGTFTPPLRTFILENKENLKNKTIAAFACQSGSGAERAFSKLKDCIGTTSFATTAIFIDPKDKPSEDNTYRLREFCQML